MQAHDHAGDAEGGAQGVGILAIEESANINGKEGKEESEEDEDVEKEGFDRLGVVGV